jgi:single-strand DNA-binding protein
MASFNKVILMGNLTRDPESRQAQSGTMVVKAGLAVNDRRPDGNGGWTDQAHFFDITLFGARGESFARFHKKGSSVLIEGRLQYSSWEDKETGQKRNKVDVLVDQWSFVGGSREGSNSESRQGGEAAPEFPAPESFGGSSSADVPF